MRSMLGQGSPWASPPPPFRAATARRGRCSVRAERDFLPHRGWVRLLGLLLLLATPAWGRPLDLKLRVEWGGGEEKRWRGTISVKKGEVSLVRTLGLEADEVGTIWDEDGQVRIHQREKRFYDGLDLRVSASDDAELQIEWDSDEPNTAPLRASIPLARLIAGKERRDLDQQENCLSVRRVPGDSLQVLWEEGIGPGDSARSPSIESTPRTVFATGQEIHLECRPRELGLAAGATPVLRASLSAAGQSAEIWRMDHSFNYQPAGPADGPIEISFVTPEEEGVYDLVLSVVQPGLTKRFDAKRRAAERKFQFVAVAPTRPRRAGGNGQPPTEVVYRIDPTNPTWRQRIARTPLPAEWTKGPMGIGLAKTTRRAQGAFIELRPANDKSETSWEAYPLEIAKPGEPHVLEVEYPTDTAHTLGISVVEPNAAGGITPIGLDSGAYVTSTSDDSAAGAGRHRLIFWPRTKSPLMMVTNHRTDTPAYFGRVRVLGPRARGGISLSRDESWSYLPPAFSEDRTDDSTVDSSSAAKVAPFEPTGGRLLAGYYDRPLFTENFSAPETKDPVSGRSLDDWNTFLLGGKRLVEYLRHVGHNGLMLSVFADGATIYPSAVVDSTPRYDTGVFLSSGQDPLQKDVLELLFRLFDREGLTLIPALHFASPLPRLEEWRREGTREAEGIELVDDQGEVWSKRHAPRQGLAPYYNPLDPRTREAMLEVVRELADRYGHHSSFAGLAIQLSADGYAQLPGVDWGYDSATLQRFVADTPRFSSGKDAAKDAPSLKELASRGDFREAWIEWRARRMFELYRAMRNEGAAGREGFCLYLAGAGIFDRGDWVKELRPTLPAERKLTTALREIGVDPAMFADQDDIVLTRPRRLAPVDSVAARGIDMEVEADVDFDQACRASGTAASLFFHEPVEIRVPAFDAKSPYQPANSLLVAQTSPSGSENRRRFIHALASLDARAMFDGGWLLPLGQEDELRSAFAVYRELPDCPFEEASSAATSTQPLVVRATTFEGRTWIYVANDSPFEATAQLSIAARVGAQARWLGTRQEALDFPQDGRPWTWRPRLAPFELLGLVISEPDAEALVESVDIDDTATLQLTQRLDDLWNRAQSLADRPSRVALANGDFERGAGAEKGNGKMDGDAPIFGWTIIKGRALTAHLDGEAPYQGSSCAKLTSTGSGGILRSRGFIPSDTGRLVVTAWLRIADADKQPSLRIGLRGIADGAEYHPAAALGKGQPEERRLGETWRKYEIEFRDVPPMGDASLSLEIETRGSSEIWLDDVSANDLEFSQEERRELAYRIHLAELQLERGEVGDCQRFLEGYWPRYLATHVPATADSPERMAKRDERESSAEEDEGESSGVLERLRQALPPFLR